MSRAPEHDGRWPTTGRRLASAPKNSPYIAGEIIGDKYRLVRMLGAGGMGAVWVAENIALDAAVALKLIRSDSDTTAAERLLQEARAAAKLGHPAIVRIFDFGQTGRGDPFIVMELLHGESLADVIRRETRIAATSAIQLLLPIAEALEAAHAKGIVHRDLKPDNIFISRGESGRSQPKVVDFGIAKLEHIDTKLTENGSLLGSPDYMSPEQARGLEDMDLRTDVWSFCVVAYEAVTGRPPFTGPNYNALLRSIVEDEPTPMTEFAAGDPELWAIVQRGLHKDPAERWGSMRELGEALAFWLYQRGIKEDVCAQSLRASWLDGAAASRRPAVPDSGAPPPLTLLDSSGDVALATPRAYAPRRLRRMIRDRHPALLVAAFVLATGFGFLTLRLVAGGAVTEPRGAAPSASPPPASRATAAAPSSAPRVNEPEPVPPATNVAPAASAARKAPVKWHPNYRPGGHPGPATAPAKPKSKRSRLDEDLGF